MRGVQLFVNLFNETETLPACRQSKGRSGELDARRNELLLHRFYYYGKHTAWRYERILEQLSNEFFITERRIQDIIQEQQEQLRELRQEAPQPAAMRQRWPHLMWR